MELPHTTPSSMPSNRSSRSAGSLRFSADPVGGQSDKILDHRSQRGQPCLNDISGFSSKKEYNRQQTEKQVNTDICQSADSLKSMQQRICIYSTCYQQNNYIDDCPAHRMWNSSPMIVAISGVATLKVVAVPAGRANTASRSMILPRPNPFRIISKESGRQLSE